MSIPLDPRIANWLGGKLTVKRLQRIEISRGVFREVVAPSEVMAWPLTDETWPLSTGLAFPSSRVIVPVDAVPGVVVEIECRTLVIQAVGIRSLEDGPELTQSVLRKIGSLRDIVIKAASRETLRLNVDENGEVYGVPLGDPLAKQLDAQGAGDDAPADVIERAVRRMGRPPLPEEHKQEVADVVAEAKTLRKPITKAVAEHFGIPEKTAKTRIRTAREEGYWSISGRPLRATSRRVTWKDAESGAIDPWTAITEGGED